MLLKLQQFLFLYYTKFFVTLFTAQFCLRSDWLTLLCALIG